MQLFSNLPKDVNKMYTKLVDGKSCDQLVLTCRKLVIIKPRQAIQTRPDMGSIATSLRKTFCNLQASGGVFTMYARFTRGIIRPLCLKLTRNGSFEYFVQNYATFSTQSKLI